MRFVEKENQLRFFRVADLGQCFEQFAHQPQQKGRIELGIDHQPVGHQDVDEPPASRIDAKEFLDVERGLAEELVTALAFQLQQGALDRADAGATDIAVLRRKRLGVVGCVGEHRPQIGQVEQ